MPNTAPITPQADRREKFRAYMRAFNPTAPAFEMIKAGLVLEDLHQSLHKSLAARADLEPGSQQLVVGGIGSGKTTELLLAAQSLSLSGKTLPLYIDITAETDLSELNSGALVASFGVHLSGSVMRRNLDSQFSTAEIEELQERQSVIDDFAYGKTEYIPTAEKNDEKLHWLAQTLFAGLGAGLDSPYTTYEIQGKLTPLPALSRDIEEVQELLHAFISALKKFELEAVVIFDGLDRLIQPEKFWAVVEQDLRFFRKLPVSVLMTAPISVLYGAGRSISDYFDKVHHLAAIMTPDPKHEASLHSLLQRRGRSVLLDSHLASHIVFASGGVLRDLITLARDAGEEAYISGHEMIRPDDVEKADRQLGIAYRRGLGPSHLKILNELATNGSFNPSTPKGVELLLTRRVLEYAEADFRVHPALSPLLKEQSK
jgi:hypothetical protein